MILARYATRCEAVRAFRHQKGRALVLAGIQVILASCVVSLIDSELPPRV